MRPDDSFSDGEQPFFEFQPIELFTGCVVSAMKEIPNINQLDWAFRPKCSTQNISFPAGQISRNRIGAAEKATDHLLNELLPHSRSLRYIIQAYPDDQPIVIQKVHMPHPLIGILPAIELRVMRAVRIDFDCDMNT